MKPELCKHCEMEFTTSFCKTCKKPVCQTCAVIDCEL